MITFVVENHIDEDKIGKAGAWEAVFNQFMKEYSSPNMTISFKSEVRRNLSMCP